MSADEGQLEASELSAERVSKTDRGSETEPRPKPRLPKLQRLKTLAETGAPWAELEVLNLTARIPTQGLTPEEKLRVQVQRLISLRRTGQLSRGWRLGQQVERQIRDLPDDHAVVLLELLRIGIMTQRLSQAREYMATAIALNPQLSVELRGLLPLALGWLYLHVGDTERALQFTTEVTGFAPPNHRYRVLSNPLVKCINLAWMYAAQHRFSEALPYCKAGFESMRAEKGASVAITVQLMINHAFVTTGLNEFISDKEVQAYDQLTETTQIPRQIRVWALLKVIQQILKTPEQSVEGYGSRGNAILGEMWAADDPTPQIESYALMLAENTRHARDWASERQARDHALRAARIIRQQSGTLMGDLIEISCQAQISTGRTAQLVSRLKTRSRALDFSKVDFATRMAAIAEARDYSTGTHNYRVAALTGTLAQALGSPPKYIKDLMLAAQLHDLSKITIPDGILLKAGPLTSEEWAVMQTHTSRGAELLRGGRSRVIRLAHDIAACHHERWDGKGYPARLSGAAIPLAARMVAVADVFDALIQARPYKAAWTFEEAVTEIQRNAGLQFDPEIIAVFDKLVLNGELRGILALYG